MTDPEEWVEYLLKLFAGPRVEESTKFGGYVDRPMATIGSTKDGNWKYQELSRARANARQDVLEELGLTLEFAVRDTAWRLGKAPPYRHLSPEELISRARIRYASLYERMHEMLEKKPRHKNNDHEDDGA